jgi:hypothetical protein
LQPPETAPAGGDRTPLRGVLGQNLADKKHLITSAADGLANQFLRTAIGIHFRRVDQGHAQIQAEAQGGDFLLPASRAFGEVPSTLA